MMTDEEREPDAPATPKKEWARPEIEAHPIAETEGLPGFGHDGGTGHS